MKANYRQHLIGALNLFYNDIKYKKFIFEKNSVILPLCPITKDKKRGQPPKYNAVLVGKKLVVGAPTLVTTAPPHTIFLFSDFHHFLEAK